MVFQSFEKQDHKQVPAKISCVFPEVVFFQDEDWPLNLKLVCFVS